jgi:hypothetical protein
MSPEDVWLMDEVDFLTVLDVLAGPDEIDEISAMLGG